MRAILILTAVVTAAALAATEAPGRPKADRPEVKTAATVKAAAAAFAESVATQVGADAELTYAARIADSACRGGNKPVTQILTALKGSVKKVAWEGEAPKLTGDEQLAVEVGDAKGGRKLRFAVAYGVRDHPNDPSRTEPFLRCTSSALTVIYEVIDLKEVIDLVNLPATNTGRSGPILAPPPPDWKPASEIAVPGFGTIRLHKRQGKDGLDLRPLPFEVRKFDLTPTASGWRYRCPELTPETAFEVAVTNERPFAWAVDVELDGRSSTAEAGGRFAGAKYIIPGTPAGKKGDEYFIRGWLKEAKGKAGADGVQSFEYTEFLVKNVPDADPALAKIAEGARSTIRVAWYGAWPAGTPRPKELPNPQSGGPIVGQGKHGTQELKVVEYTTDERPQGSVVIEFGGRAK